jgi:tellurite resistance protein TehA-like permease
VLGKVAKHNFKLTGTLTTIPRAGETFYLVGLLLGIILWGFAIIWFVVAVIMISTARSFPFNMGWWGFIFPVGEFVTDLSLNYAEIYQASLRS